MYGNRTYTPKDSNIRNTCHINGPCDIQPYTNAITNDFKTLTIRLKKKAVQRIEWPTTVHVLPVHVNLFGCAVCCEPRAEQMQS